MGSTVMNFMEEKLLPVAAKIAAQRHVRALRDGLSVTMPIIIAGSIFMIIANLPIPGYTEFMSNLFGPNFIKYLTYPLRATMDILSLIAVFSVSYYLAKDKELDGVSAGAIALSSFLLLIPVDTINQLRYMQTLNFGTGGLIVAIFTAIITTEIYIRIIERGVTVTMPDSVPPAVAQSFMAIAPGIVSIALFLVIRIWFEHSSFENVFNFIQIVLGAPLKSIGLSFTGTICMIFVYHLFWAVGVHGTRVVFGVTAPILYAAMEDNMLATEAGQAVPHIVTRQWHDIFINGMGGCGATLGLLIVILFFTHSKQLKTLGKLALGPAIFNISEPIIFGMPVVLNPMIMIPFILGPVASGIVTYLAMSAGLVQPPTGVAIPWTTPVIIGGWLATSDWRAAILQVVNILVVAAIYYPFVKSYDNKLLEMETKANTEAANSKKCQSII